MAFKWIESRQGRQNRVMPMNDFFRPFGAFARFDLVPTVETVGYYRSSLTGLLNPCASVSSVINQEIVRRVAGQFAPNRRREPSTKKG